jgi:hypothetical protein
MAVPVGASAAPVQKPSVVEQHLRQKADPRWFISLSRLSELCSDKSREDACLGYVMGELDADPVSNGSPKVKQLVCFPDRFEIGDAQPVITTGLQFLLAGHPEAGGKSAAPFVFLLMASHYPCPEQGGRP